MEARSRRAVEKQGGRNPVVTSARDDSRPPRTGRPIRSPPGPS
jgi:hypothetical protein